MTPRLPARHLATSLLVALIAACVYLPRLGASGFASSEGFRALPAWSMIDSHEWDLPTLFGQAYVRKPPGLPWAIGVLSMALGKTEFAARLASALATILASVLTSLFAGRWLGRPWNLVAGSLYAVTPLFVAPGRAAEIEALHNLFCLTGSLVLLDLLVFQRVRGGLTPRLSAWWLGLGFVLGAMLLTKGPAGLPLLGGTLLACAFSGRSLRAAFNPGLFLSVLVGGALFAWWLYALRADLCALHGQPVIEPPARFLWKPGHAGQVLALLPVSLIGAAPSGLGVVLVLWPRRTPAMDEGACRMGRAAAWACVCSLLVYTIVGVSNNRYAMPVLTLTPLTLAAALQRGSERPVLDPIRRVLVGGAWVWIGALFIGAIAQAAWQDYRRETRTSGRNAGVALGEFLPDGAVVWGDQFIDTRPEVLWYAQRRAGELGKRVDVRWVPQPEEGVSVPPPGVYWIIRDDSHVDAPMEPEWERVKNVPQLTGEPAFRGMVHVFSYRLYKMGS